MEKSQMSKLIPDEILVEILSRLPFESLHKFKWVSKSRRSLITGEIFPRTLNTPLLGFIYSCFNRPFTYISITRDDDDDAAIDPELSFLPQFPDGFRILGCCNGLVLSTHVIQNAPTYVVCNPLTKSWTQLPLVDQIPSHNFIDFDPSISPHYKVVAVWGHRNQVFFNVYCSERRRWEQKRIDIGDCILSNDRPVALWDGDVYVCSPSCNAGLCFGYGTVRIGLSGRADDFEPIKFPSGAKKLPDKMHGGRLGDGKLCFAGLDGLRLWAWTLRGKGESEWVLEHDSTIPGLSERYTPLIVGFHPLRNTILLLSNNEIFAYDLMERSLVELCRIGKEGTEISPTLVFPFVPCSYVMLENQVPPTK